MAISTPDTPNFVHGTLLHGTNWTCSGLLELRAGKFP